MKIFDFKNPRHIQILREEISRAKKMLREYNEADEWKQMPQEYREMLLSTVDDDMGPDFADEYSDTEWMNIPDAVTNRININDYTLPVKYSKSKMIDIIEKNKTRLGQNRPVTGNHNVNDVIRFISSGNPSRYYVYQVLTALFNAGVTINLNDLATTEYQGTSGSGDQSIIGKWIHSDREAGKKSGLD